jgi:phosphoribosylformylglycinamidine synthase
MLTLSGAPALSEFRTTRLLTALRSRVPAVESLTTRYTHFVQTGRALTTDERRVLDALLTYGSALAGDAIQANDQLIVVIPRPGTISPWSSKATDIAQVCGLKAIERIERGITYFVRTKSPLSPEQLQSLAPALFDRTLPPPFALMSTSSCLAPAACSARI